MPPKAKVLKLEKTPVLLPFCTTNDKSATMNCQPENNYQDEASKPSSSEEQKVFDQCFIYYNAFN